LLFEIIGWAGLYWELDQQLGVGVQFWGLIVLASGGILIAWFSMRALVARRGWFTLKELLAFVLLIGALLGWAGNLFQRTRDQRLVAQYFTARGGIVTFGGDDEPGFERWLGREYFYGIKIVHANLRQVTADDLTLLSRLPELEWLYLEGGVITEAHLRPLADLPTVRGLTLEAAHLSSSSLAPLRGHPHVRTLNLYGSTLDDDALAHLPGIPHLSSLGLRNAPISDHALVHLERCPHLNWLVLDNTRLTDSGLIHLADLPLLTLSLGGTSITDAGLEHVAKIESLQELDLMGTSVSDAGMEHLTVLKQLRLVVVANTGVTAEAAESLERKMPAPAGSAVGNESLSTALVASSRSVYNA
jgi:hypothetical protein